MIGRPDDAPSLPDRRTTVVVLTHNHRDALLRTLSLLTALPGRPPVAVVDNASTDGGRLPPGAVRRRRGDPARLRPGGPGLGGVPHP
ncbi:hypothetical protein [Streptomyces sp. NPDC046887]|uniref:hypothetical protein n=1 Tax=Streptomyces sp. NPDC046887 TaxID=3155472 RepID=UPI0033EA93FD